MIIQKFSPNKRRAVIIDGTAVLFQNYFSPRLKDRSKAWLESLSQIRELFKAVAGKYWLVVFDAGPTSFRNLIYPSYKANRGEPPEDLVPQFDLLYKSVEKCGIMVSMVKGYEADDLIAHWSKKADRDQMQCMIISQDKDLYQLLARSISIFNPRKQEVLDLEAFKAKYRVSSQSWPLIQAISGDSSDNYPGVKGVGQKSALSMAIEMGDSFSIDEIKKFVFSEKVDRAALKCRNQLNDLKLFLKVSTLEDSIPSEEARSWSSAKWNPEVEQLEKYFLEINQKRRLSAWTRLVTDYRIKFNA